MSIARQLQAPIRARALQKVNTARIRIEGDLDMRVPVKTGATKRSRRTRVQAGSQVIALEVEYPIEYAGIVDKGPRAHVIRSRPGGPTLRFVIGGRVLFRRRVNWRPGAGVARNRRWFSGAVTLTKWRQALR